MKIYCPYCRQPYEVEENYIGMNVDCCSCGKSFIVSQPEKTKRCPYCGEVILDVAKKCKYCGEFLQKNRAVYIVLGLFLGGIGAHNFYLKQYYRGAAKIFISLLGNILFTESDTLGGVILLFNSFWIIGELFIDPNNKESIKKVLYNKKSMKKVLFWLCIVLGAIIDIIGIDVAIWTFR